LGRYQALPTKKRAGLAVYHLPLVLELQQLNA
jgi:hypothetical protein